MTTEASFAELVYKMRQAQKAYFKNRLNKDLQESKQLEREVDNEVSRRVIGQVYKPQESTGKLF